MGPNTVEEALELAQTHMREATRLRQEGNLEAAFAQLEAGVNFYGAAVSMMNDQLAETAERAGVPQDVEL